MFKPIRVALTAALLTIASYGIAAEMREGHPDTYVVKKGDTLWDIAGRFLKRPWLWPEIWQANPQIKNPHLIYPGDVISLAYLNRVAQVTPGPRQEAPIDAIPLAQVEPFLKNMRVVDDIESLPYVVALEEDRLRGTQGQLAYVKGLEGAQPGQRFAIVRPTVRYTRIDRDDCCDLFLKDDLDYRGRRLLFEGALWTNAFVAENGRELLGYELAQLTTGTVSRVPGDGVDTTTLVMDASAGREVRVGDRLVPVEAQPYDLRFFPHPPKQSLEYGRARVLAIADMLTSGGPRDVVALSVGSRDGVDNGTVFSTWRVGSTEPDRVKIGFERDGTLVGRGDKVRLPDEYAGHVMVFRTFENVSYALVMSGVRPTRVGYELKHPDAPY
ncbi:LysM peptidoglycan-binding domain-containing protein [Vulcaniibacterium thermophilum]|uniref:Peptidoglycan-binding protein LysM n=1 Tax=Vulcaniibacterium thermophilum TaxID=1169913 RepID=A0A918Z7F0_9GAMM|nr:LysM peptidoglycan-binding domain-containing protein [Vulcaniibacterium thermophilum]GHE40185.1 peptidoglycan-binding protein LysM [Vulcaniibacterium thermophilum]